jgi:general secretion pathway protein M
MEFIKKYLNLKKLNRREKYIIYTAGCLVGLLILVHFVVTPFFESRKQMQRSLQTKKGELEEMRRLQAEHRALQENLQVSKIRFSKREKRFTLYSFLDQLAGQTGIKDRITSMKPTKTIQKNSNYKISRVEMKLDNITLEQLAKVSISKKEKKQGLVNVILQVETVEA